MIDYSGGNYKATAQALQEIWERMTDKMGQVSGVTANNSIRRYFKSTSRVTH